MEHTHNFKIGDRVELSKAPVNVSRGPYKVTGLMPGGRDGEPQYRIKSENENVERVVTQAEISPRQQSSAFNA